MYSNLPRCLNLWLCDEKETDYWEGRWKCNFEDLFPPRVYNSWLQVYLRRAESTRKGDEMASLQSGSWPHLILGFKPGKALTQEQRPMQPQMKMLHQRNIDVLPKVSVQRNTFV